MRNFLFGNSVKIGEKLLQPSDISKVLSATKSFDSKHKVERLVNPDDRQNVDLATDFLLQLSKVDMKCFMEQGFRLSNVAEELNLFTLLFYITTYLYTISIAAHVLSILQRNLKAFLPISFVMICRQHSKISFTVQQSGRFIILICHCTHCK